MTADPALGGQGGDLRHGIDDPMGVRGCGSHHQHGVGGDRRGRGDRIGAQVRADRHRVQRDPQVVRGLGERGVRGGRHDDPRTADPGVRVAGRLDRQQQRLGATRGHRADRALIAAEQLGRGGDQGVLHHQQGREGGRVQAVDMGRSGVRGLREPVQPGDRGVVDVREQPTAVRGQVARPQVTQLGQHLLGRDTVHRQRVDHDLTLSVYGLRNSAPAPTSTAGTSENPSSTPRRAVSSCTAACPVDEDTYPKICSTSA